MSVLVTCGHAKGPPAGCSANGLRGWRQFQWIAVAEPGLFCVGSEYEVIPFPQTSYSLTQS